MIHEFFWLITGMVGIWFSAGFVVNSAQKIAKSIGISEAFIGLTILSIGTSLAEITTHIVASYDILQGIDAAGVAVGTNIGSNIIQITFIVGVIGLLTKITSEKEILNRDYIVMLFSIALLFLFCIDSYLSKIEGLILVVLYLGYLLLLAQNENLIEKNPFKTNYILDGCIVLGGLAVLVMSANTVVENAVIISNELGISGSFIGALLIGVSTALPEFTTALQAILKGSMGMSLGTLIGSNITNPLLAIGIGAIISGYSIDNYILWFDLPFWFFISLLVFWFFWRGLRMKRYESVILIISYFVYAGVRLLLLKTSL